MIVSRYSRGYITTMSAKARELKVVRSECRVLGHIWIEGPAGALLGMGRVELLEYIRARGSITAAARAMGMSYRHAWELIDSMNRQLGVPLVVKEAGGRGGGGTKLTVAGEDAISAYRELDTAFRRFKEERTRVLSEGGGLTGKGHRGRKTASE